MTPEEIKALQDNVAAQAASIKALEDNNKLLLAEKKTKADEAEVAKAEAAALKTKAAQDAGDFKTLAETYKADNEKLKAENSAKEALVVNSAKSSNLSNELAKLGAIAERLPNIMKLADLGKIKFDDATKTVYGADVVAKELQAQMPELFGTKKAPPSDSGNAGGGAGGAMTLEEFNKLPEDEKKKQYKAFFKSRGHEIR